MATFQIFSHEVLTNQNNQGKTQEFAVWLTDGHLQFVIDGQIQHDITTVNEFLIAAAEAINKGNDENEGNLKFSGSGVINENSVENFDGSDKPVFDSNGGSPFISSQDANTAVRFSGSNISGNFTVDFGTGDTAEAEASQFKSFAEDLLGKAEATQIANISGNIGGFNRTVKISQREDDIRQVKFKDSRDVADEDWADRFIDALGEEFGGTRTSNGNVSEKNYTASQLSIGSDPLIVNLGPNGVGGTERWQFSTEGDAEDFFNAVKGAFQDGDRRVIINSAIEDLAEELGGVQTKNGNVSTNYEARQIKLAGDGTSVNLGSHGVGGKETYKFDDKATALEFIDGVRDLVGVNGKATKLVDEFIFTVTGQNIGSETFVGKDEFVEWLGVEFGGTMTRDGSVSESFDGSSRAGTSSDGFTVTLGPRGVGGKEVWTFAEENDALEFASALEEYMI